MAVSQYRIARYFYGSWASCFIACWLIAGASENLLASPKRSRVSQIDYLHKDQVKETCFDRLFMSLPPLKNGAGAYCIWLCLSVSEWVSLCVPKTLLRPYLKNQWREFHPIFASNVFVFIDVLIRFWGQMSKVKVPAGITVDGNPLSSIWLYLHRLLNYNSFSIQFQHLGTM